MSGCELGVADDGADCVAISKASCFELNSSSGFSVPEFGVQVLNMDGLGRPHNLNLKPQHHKKITRSA